MMNIYNGNAILDDQGEVVVQLPDWFEALNQDFRYQLTCLHGFAPVYIDEEISGNRFKIAGGKPGMKISWQVTGVRHDPYANAHRIVVEEEKPAEERFVDVILTEAELLGDRFHRVIPSDSGGAKPREFANELVARN